MIYIVHGDNYATSRKLISNQQKTLGNSSKKNYEANEITPETLFLELSTQGIFGDAPFIVLDISQETGDELTEYVEKIKAATNNFTLIVLSNKTLGKTNPFIKNAQVLNAKVIENSEQQKSNIFKFVDLVYSKNRKATYQELIQLQNEGVDMFYIASMLIYGLRNIMHAKTNSTAYQKQTDFVRGKSLKQASGFEEAGIKNLFESFYSIDKKMKTGELLPEIAVTLAIEKILIS